MTETDEEQALLELGARVRAIRERLMQALDILETDGNAEVES
jgi:hypothetical protein